MPRPVVRSIQLALPLRARVKGARRSRIDRRRRRPRERLATFRCPFCRGPMATGEGAVSCVVCGHSRMAPIGRSSERPALAPP